MSTGIQTLARVEIGTRSGVLSGQTRSGTSLGVESGGTLNSRLGRLQAGCFLFPALSLGSLEGNLESNEDDKTEDELTRVFFFRSLHIPSEGRLCLGHFVYGVRNLWSRSARAGESSVSTEQETGSTKGPAQSLPLVEWCSAGAEKQAMITKPAASLG